MTKRLFETDVALELNALCGSLSGKKILVGLSGGADSVCLLTVLKAISDDIGFKLYAIHINHMIRGAEADRDEEFCRGLCKDIGVPLEAVRADIPAAARLARQSLELCAREFRYKAFIKHCEDNEIDYIATAHNANDNAETVLYNILRGSGLDGICGIPKKRDNIIRPILGKTRVEILAYLNECKQAYVTDSTNLENDYTRNYIRNVLLPCAAKVNGNAVGALNKLSQAASVDAEYMNGVVKDMLSGDKPCKLNNLPKALQIRAVRKICMDKCGFLPDSKHINAICTGLDMGGEKHFSIPNGYKAVTCNGNLSFIKADYEESVIVPAVIKEGKNFFANGSVCVELRYGTYRKGLEFSDKLMFSVSLNRASIIGELRVRPRESGDSFTARNIGRNIKKCFINKKIPASLRELIPVICDDEGIVYVPYIGAADRVYQKNSKDTCNITVAIERVGQQ